MTEIKAAYTKLSHSLEGSDESVRVTNEAIVHEFSGCNSVLDVGCGRGVMMELLEQSGTVAYGIDGDSDLVDVLRDKGLNAIWGHLPGDLARFENGTFDGVFLGHIIEHFNGTEAFELVYRSSLLLRSGGKMVIQTPYYGNPKVASELFWRDITHVRPYPMVLLMAMLKSVAIDPVPNSCRVLLESRGLDVVVVGIAHSTA